MEKNTIQAFESLNYDVRARSQAHIMILGLHVHETDAKNRTSRISDSQLTNPFEMVKKTIQAFESLNSDVRARSQVQITILSLDEHETDAKKRTSRNSDSELTNPLEMVKKTIQAVKSLNYDVRARSQAKITISGLDEHETDAKNRTSRNSDYELTNPLEMVKKNNSGF